MSARVMPWSCTAAKCLLRLLLILAAQQVWGSRRRDSKDRDRAHMLLYRSPKDFSDPADSISAHHLVDEAAEALGPQPEAPPAPATADDTLDEEPEGRERPDKIQGIAHTRPRRRGEADASTGAAQPAASTVDERHRLTSCPPCVGPSGPVPAAIPALLRQALTHHWRRSWGAYGCACQVLLSQPSHGLAQSIVHALHTDPPPTASSSSSSSSSSRSSSARASSAEPLAAAATPEAVIHSSLLHPPSSDAAPIDVWEVIGASSVSTATNTP